MTSPLDRRRFLAATAALGGAALYGSRPAPATADAAPPAAGAATGPASARTGSRAVRERTGAAAGSADFVLSDAVVLTLDDERRVYESGYVWVRDGAVHRVGPVGELADLPDDLPRRRLAGRLVMPGLVNCHTHLSNGILRGLYDEMPLEVWFSRGMWPVLDALERGPAAVGARLALHELMTSGVTTVASGEFGTPHPELVDGVLGAVRESGIRALVSRMTIDSADPTSAAQFIPERYRETPAHALDELRRLRRAWNSPRVEVVPEALGVLRCTPDMVRAMHAFSVEAGCSFTMHAASSADERDESRRRFGHGSIAELERLGVLGPRTLLAHAIWLEDAEIARLAERGTGISHNPVSNAYYASGVARLAELLEAGVRVGLGTDGASTNNGQNLWETMKMALLFQKERLSRASFGSAELALELATRGGAGALHLERRIGSLAPGLRADLVVLDLERVALAPRQTLVSNLVYSNDPGAVRDVYVDGELVVENGVHRHLDREALVAEAREALAQVLRGSGLDRYLETRGRWRWIGRDGGGRPGSPVD